MIMSDVSYYDVNLILYGLTALILFLTLIYSAFIKKGREKKDKVLYAMLSANAVGALAGSVDIFCEINNLSQHVRILTIIVYTLSIYLTCLLFAIYMACNIGYDEKLKKHALLWLLPFITAAGMIIVIFLDPGIAQPFSLYALLTVSRVIACSYMIAGLCFLWRIDKTLVLLPAMLLMMLVYFSIAIFTVTVSAFIISLCVIYVYLSLTKKMILIHLGGITLVLFAFTTLVIGNMVTSSAFVSYLRTIHDRNDSHLSDVIITMKSYRSLPWLMEYWTENAQALAEDLKSESADSNNEISDRKLAEVTSEQAESYSADEQFFFAKICYERIADYFEQQFIIHNLDDLFLIVPDESDNALILFDAERNADGTYRLGQYRDILEEEKEWNNYETVITDNTTWIWGQYSSDDDFGFFREIPFGNSDQSAFLCNSFKRSEIYEHMNFVSASRSRAIRYLILSAFIILLSLYLMLLNPLSKISRTVQRYQMDKDPDTVEADMKKIQLKNEIGSFADEFTSLAHEMDRYTKQAAQLAGEKERVNTELRMASDIQVSALPRIFPAFPDRTDFDIYGGMHPAKAVGGDFYDFFLLDEDHLAFLIADVSDKGVPAALFMMSAKNLINYRTHEGGTPAEIMTAVNSHLCDNNDACMFVTAWLGILDLSTGILTCVNAGHEPPALKIGEGPFYMPDNGGHGSVIGLMPDGDYKDREIKLAYGDIIFLYTDGVKDALNVSEDYYGAERMLACLEKAKDETPEGIIRSLNEDIDAFTGGAEQFDDITMLCVKYTKP